MENENELVEETTTNQEEEVEETQERSVEDLQKELATLKAQKDHWKKKASDTTVKQDEAVVTSSPVDSKSEPSFLDGVLLAKADIHEQDIERVLKFAKGEGISVKEALANDDMKAILDRRNEARKTAEASNTSSVKAGQASKSGEAILKSANAKNMPDIDDLEAMWDAETKR